MSTSNEDTVEAAAAVASTEAEPKHPGIPVAEDGSGAVVHVEAAASERSTLETRIAAWAAEGSSPASSA